MNQESTPGWFPDPFGRYQHRWWDGLQWTEHVGSSGTQSIDSPVVAPPTRAAALPVQGSLPATANASVSKNVQRQMRQLGVSNSTQLGGGTLLTEQILVVNQKAKLFERRAEYSVFSPNGSKVGGVRQFGTSMSSVIVGQDNATKRFQIVDADGQPFLTVTRPATVLKSTVTIMREDGSNLGRIVQENFGVMASLLGGRFNIRFRMESAGETLGTINAESWRAWDFSIQDTQGDEIARITKVWAGLSKEIFTKADNYVLQMHKRLEDPLLSIVVCAALVVDTVLNQDGERRRR
ncbi:phospholipid scramblase-related protein [Salinibacterium sp.]|uniref:phospholipid scramblase-related protein n=1 Tax=Salinibacterium sp. TaxID=1915057 RepID=UPI00286CF9A4|nr:phospholipid scramblase-related protein [Salinibacterium sp.]